MNTETEDKAQVTVPVAEAAGPVPPITSLDLLEKLLGFLDESLITVPDDPQPLYAGGIDLQPLGRELCKNDFIGTVKQAKDFVRAMREGPANQAAYSQRRKDHTAKLAIHDVKAEPKE